MKRLLGPRSLSILVAAAAWTSAASGVGQEAAEKAAPLGATPASEKSGGVLAPASTSALPPDAQNSGFGVVELPAGQVRYLSEVLILKSDWRKLNDVEGADRELRESLKDVPLDARLGRPTLANAPQILFSSIALYSPEKFDAFVAWLRRYEILEHRIAGDAPTLKKIDRSFQSIVRVPAEKYLRPDVETTVLPLVETSQEWTWSILKSITADDYGVQGECTTRRKPLGGKEVTTDRLSAPNALISFPAPENKVVLVPSQLGAVRQTYDTPPLMAIVVIHTGVQRWPVAERAAEPKLTLPEEVILDSLTRRSVMGGGFGSGGKGNPFSTSGAEKPAPSRSRGGGWSMGASSSGFGEKPQFVDNANRTTGGDGGQGSPTAKPEKHALKAYPLRHARVAETTQLLERLLGANGPGADFRVAADAATNQLVVFADPNTHATVKEFVETIDRTPPSATSKSGSPGGPASSSEVDRAARPSLEVLSTLALERDVQSVRTAERLRERLNADPKGEQAETRALENQLRREIAEAFESRQRVSAAQVADFDDRLTHAKQVFELRERAKEQILRRRLEELRTQESLDKLREKILRTPAERPLTPTSKASEKPIDSSSAAVAAYASPTQLPLKKQPRDYRDYLQHLAADRNAAQFQLNRLRETLDDADNRALLETQIREHEDRIKKLDADYQFARDEWQTHVKLLELDVQDATNGLEHAKSQHERLQQAAQKGAAPTSEVEQVRTQAVTAATRLEAAQVLLNLYLKVEEPDPK